MTAAQLPQTQIYVPPIMPGLKFMPYQLQLSGLTGIDLTTATRLFAQFRDAFDNGNIIATLDSAAGTPNISAPSASVLQFFLSATATLAFNIDTPAYVDFLALVSGDWIALPFQMRWPVRNPITAHP